MPHARSRSQSTTTPQPVNIFSGFQNWRRRRGSTSVPASPLGTSSNTNDNASFPTSSAGLSRTSSDRSHQPNQLYLTDEEEQSSSLSPNVHQHQQHVPKNIRDTTTTIPATATGGTSSSDGLAIANTNTTTTTTSTEMTEEEEENLHIRLLPNIGLTSRCFVFDIIERVLTPSTVLRIGRYSERHTSPERLSFKSKVVSRTHAELWMEQGKKIFIRDVGSSSGTFVNRVRISASNEISAPMELKDGDIIQFGVDYQGGIDMVYRSVKIRLEINRDNSNKTNSFSRQAFQQLRHHLLGNGSNSNDQLPPTIDNNITTTTNGSSTMEIIDQPEILKKRDMTSQGIIISNSSNNNNNNNNTNDHALNIQECCICLYAIAPLQALFVAPCSHVFHFKCLRPIILQHYPGFSCPLCRNYYDLEASVAIEVSEVAEAMGLSTSDGKFTSVSDSQHVAPTSSSSLHVPSTSVTGPDTSLPSIMQTFSSSSSSSSPPIQTNDHILHDIPNEEDSRQQQQQQNGMGIPGIQSTQHLQPGNMDGFLLSSTLVDPSMLDQEGGNLSSSL